MCDLCPPVANPWIGAINAEALAEFCAEIGITREVDIQINPSLVPERANGCYDLTESAARHQHVIYMSANLTVEKANQTLVHELLHASQMESVGEAQMLATALTGEKGHALIEQGVDEFAQMWADFYSLTTSGQPAVVV